MKPTVKRVLLNITLSCLASLLAYLLLIFLHRKGSVMWDCFATQSYHTMQVAFPKSVPVSFHICKEIHPLKSKP